MGRAPHREPQRSRQVVKLAAVAAWGAPDLWKKRLKAPRLRLIRDAGGVGYELMLVCFGHKLAAPVRCVKIYNRL